MSEALLDRNCLVEKILSRLASEEVALRQMYQTSESRIGYFFIDDLLPPSWAKKVYDAFPDTGRMKAKKSLREYKYIAAQMDQYDPILEEIIYAFQDKQVVRFIGSLCGINPIHPDEYLYAGGISVMAQGQFLNPHVDNSHDKDRARWRVLNLLYYVSPGWVLENGGNLELWPSGIEGGQITIQSKFNRLVVMATHDTSWHSVSPVQANSKRCCVSNYYFSDQPLIPSQQFHVTSFRGRPDQRVRDLVLRADGKLRMSLRKIFSKGVIKPSHVYRK